MFIGATARMAAPHTVSVDVSALRARIDQCDDEGVTLEEWYNAMLHATRMHDPPCTLVGVAGAWHRLKEHSEHQYIRDAIDACIGRLVVAVLLRRQDRGDIVSTEVIENARRSAENLWARAACPDPTSVTSVVDF